MIDTDGGHCGHCGNPLPEGCNLRREYCNSKCAARAWRARVHADECEGRTCLWCGGAIPLEARRGVIYCSKTCQSHSQADLRKTRRTCRQCGKTYRGNGPFCCHTCYATSRREKHHRPCPVCGRIFKPHRHEQVTCSQACRGKRAAAKRAIE